MGQTNIRKCTVEKNSIRQGWSETHSCETFLFTGNSGDIFCLKLGRYFLLEAREIYFARSSGDIFCSKLGRYFLLDAQEIFFDQSLGDIFCSKLGRYFQKFSRHPATAATAATAGLNLKLGNSKSRLCRIYFNEIVDWRYIVLLQIEKVLPTW